MTKADAIAVQFGRRHPEEVRGMLAFSAGYRYGRKMTTDRTNRFLWQAANARGFVGSEERDFVNGATDGLRCDPWRVREMRRFLEGTR